MLTHHLVTDVTEWSTELCVRVAGPLGNQVAADGDGDRGQASPERRGSAERRQGKVPASRARQAGQCSASALRSVLPQARTGKRP